MTMQIDIRCDERGCSNSVHEDEIVCPDHIEEKLKEAHNNGYDEGFEAGQKSVEPKE